ncbi:MAG: hypothetical protein ACK4FZ_02505 [Vogesella sp.]|uniref:hypothetical protein n=1 Tax=Vogesella sp. TaxID=1904252 RepID=UPI00391D23C3
MSEHHHAAHKHHAHSHPHPHGAGEDSHLPRWRLLAMPAWQRLLLALLPLALLWLLVAWALGGGA